MDPKIEPASFSAPAPAVASGELLCFSSSRPWTWRDKLRCKLFPAQHCDLPEAPASFQDVLVCRVTSELSMLDRLRVLITGRIRVESRTVTENMMGSHRTKSIFSTLPPKWWDREAERLRYAAQPKAPQKASDQHAAASSNC